MTSTEYNQCVKLHADDVFRFAVRSCGDSVRSKDAVQEAFASLWERRREVEQDKGKSFLLATIYHKLADEWRHEKVCRDNHDDMSRTTQEAYRPADTYDLKEALKQALATLPEIQRSIFTMKVVEGYSYKEISNILMISDQQVCVYLYRARVALKRKLKDYEYNA